MDALNYVVVGVGKGVGHSLRYGDEVEILIWV